MKVRPSTDESNFNPLIYWKVTFLDLTLAVSSLLGKVSPRNAKLLEKKRSSYLGLLAIVNTGKKATKCDGFLCVCV